MATTSCPHLILTALLLSGPHLMAGVTTFGDAHVFSGPGAFASSVVPADLDGDGDLDLLTGTGDSGFIGPDDGQVVAWYENLDGAGTFGPQQVLGAGTSGGDEVIAADLDGDGDLDALAASFDHDTIAWYENVDGQGCFAAQVVLVDDALRATSLGAADLDGDGDLDVLFTQLLDGRTAWVENLGGGTFGDVHPVTDLGTPTWAVAADLDGDGDLDLTVGSDPGGLIRWYANTDGLGTFGAGQHVALGDVRHLAPADLDGDSDVDLLVTLRDGLRWYENTDGLGTFGLAQVLDTLDDAQRAYAADVDGDGDADALVTQAAAPLDGVVSWYANTDGLGAFGAAQTLLDQPGRPVDARAADLDDDGDTDVVLAVEGDGYFSWLEGTGAATFGDAQLVTSPATSPTEVVAADLDGDGDLDALTAVGPAVAGLSSTIQWHANDGAGSLGLPRTVVTDTLRVDALQAEDLDGDGDLDVLAASWSNFPAIDLVGWYENSDGAGTFGALQAISFNELDRPEQVLAADLDGDGDLDVATAAGGDGQVAWFENTDGDGAFGALQLVDDTAWAQPSLDAADVDGDGDVDLLASMTTSDRIVWYANTDGLGGFSGPQFIELSGDPAMIDAADLDGDGDIDVLASFINPDVVGWYENTDGLGAFGARQDLSTTTAFALSVLAVDIDDDGDLDVLSGSGTTTTSALEWFENTDGLGTFGPAVLLTDDVKTPEQIDAGDMDGDGDTDLLSVQPAADTIAWHENLGPWQELGGGVGGSLGVPAHVGAGSLRGGEPVTLALAKAAPSSSAFLVMGLSESSAPFKGGTLVPSPTLVVGGLPVDADGELVIGFAMPVGVTPGTTLYTQLWVVDGAAPLGLAGSNGVLGTTP